MMEMLRSFTRFSLRVPQMPQMPQIDMADREEVHLGSERRQNELRSCEGAGLS